MNLARLKRNDEADALARDTQKLGPTAFSVYVLEWVFSLTSENRGDWQSALDHIAAGLKVYPTRQDNDVAMRIAFLSSKLGYDSFKSARSMAEAIGRRSDIEAYLDSLESFLLSSRDRTEDAKQLVVKWKDKEVWRSVLNHWTVYFPEVASNWQKLK